MTLDMTEAEQSLIAHGATILLPIEIDESAYNKLYYLLAYAKERYPDRRIKLMCRGDGGESWFAMAMVGAIREHGKIDGILNGHAVSSHSVIWAHCETRYVTQEGALSIHLVSIGLSGSYHAADMEGFMKDMDHLDKIMLNRLASISMRDAGWWGKRYYHPKESDEAFYASEILEMKMAKIQMTEPG